MKTFQPSAGARQSLRAAFPLTPNHSRFLPSPVKLLVALPAVVGATEAGAAIVFTDFGPSGRSGTALNFNFDGLNDSTYHFTIMAKNSLNVYPRGVGDGYGYVAQTSTLLGASQLVGPGLTFSSDALLAPSDFDTPGYVGLLQYDNGVTTYGWAEVELNSASEFTLFGIAFEDTGAAILTGDTGAAAVPEPGSAAAIAGLAAGAAAAFAARRKRRAQASATVA